MMEKDVEVLVAGGHEINGVEGCLASGCPYGVTGISFPLGTSKASSRARMGNVRDHDPDSTLR